MIEGVTHYAKARITIPVNFPNGKIACQYCKLFLRYEEAFKRYSCRLTEEWLLSPMTGVGERCPLEFTEKEEKR